MSKRNFVFALGAIFLTLSSPAEAQQPKKVPRIGYLSGSLPCSESTRVEGFRSRLCASLAMWKEGTSPLSTDMQKESTIGYPDLAADLVAS